VAAGKNNFTSFVDYFQQFPPEVVERLQEIRECVRKVAPLAEEVISYNMPAFKQKKILVYFAAFENHIGLYALPSGNEAFMAKLKTYKTGKGSIQFPFNQPLPIELIREIVEFRLLESGK
jgi:uncharacterized protein YdhG (YjbR/CyaY superfamily)